MDLAGGLVESGLPPLAPGVEEGALDGQNAVKAGEKQRWALGLAGVGWIFEQRDQFERQAGWAEQVAGAAGFVEGREPAAEGRRILLPAAARIFSQKSRRIGAKQFVGFHGQSGQAMARAFEQSGHVPVRAGNVRPERLLLQRVQQQAAVERALFPFSADKALPVQDVGRGPGGESLGAAGAMEGELQGRGRRGRWP